MSRLSLCFPVATLTLFLATVTFADEPVDPTTAPPYWLDKAAADAVFRPPPETKHHPSQNRFQFDPETWLNRIGMAQIDARDVAAARRTAAGLAKRFPPDRRTVAGWQNITSLEIETGMGRQALADIRQRKDDQVGVDLARLSRFTEAEFWIDHRPRNEHFDRHLDLAIVEYRIGRPELVDAEILRGEPASIERVLPDPGVEEIGDNARVLLDHCAEMAAVLAYAGRADDAWDRFLPIADRSTGSSDFVFKRILGAAYSGRHIDAARTLAERGIAMKCPLSKGRSAPHRSQRVFDPEQVAAFQAESGDVKGARNTLDAIPEIDRDDKYGRVDAVIDACAGKGGKAEKFFGPDDQTFRNDDWKLTWAFMIGDDSARVLAHTKTIYDSGELWGIYVARCLARNGRLADALKLIDAETQRPVARFYEMIAMGLTESGHLDEAKKLLDTQPDSIVRTNIEFGIAEGMLGHVVVDEYASPLRRFVPVAGEIGPLTPPAIGQR